MAEIDLPSAVPDATARDFCLQGESYYRRSTREDNATAAALFTKALEWDPGHAEAYVGLSDVYTQRGHNLGLDRAWLDAAIDAANRAIGLDPTLAAAYRSLAVVYLHKGWLRKGLAAAREAFELKPDDSVAAQMIGWMLWFTGRADEAVPWMEQGVALQPTDPWAYFYAGNAYLGSTDYPRAEAMYGRSVELQPNLSSGHAGLIFTYLSQGKDAQAGEQASSFRAAPPDEPRYFVKAADVQLFLGPAREARRLAERAVADAPDARYRPRGVCPTTLLGGMLWSEGDRGAAEDLLERTISADQQRLDEGDEGYEVHYDLAAVHAIRGDRIAALAHLGHAIDAGWRGYPLARRDPLLANLHGNEPFQRMMTDVEAEVDEAKQRVAHS